MANLGHEVQWTWVDFELGEDVRGEARLMQDDAWKNAISDGRAHISHREYSGINKEEFVGAIRDYRIIQLLLRKFRSMEESCLSTEVIRHIIQYVFPPQLPLLTASYKQKMVDLASAHSFEYPFRLCVRCRPLLGFECAMGAYSCVDTLALEKKITLHDGKMSRSGRRLTMAHRQYVFDRVCGPGVTNETICSSEIAPLIQWTESGNSSTLLCFGQTGTGKTYTMNAALEYVVKELLGKFALEVVFYEIHGKKCYDLLAGRRVVHLRSDENEVVHPRGAKHIIVSSSEAAATAAACSSALFTCTQEALVSSDGGGGGKGGEEEERDNEDGAAINSGNSSNNRCNNGHSSKDGSDGEVGTVISPHELLPLLQEALKLRSSEVTERNPVSSRSHAILTIKILQQPLALSMSTSSTILAVTSSAAAAAAAVRDDCDMQPAAVDDDITHGGSNISSSKRTTTAAAAAVTLNGGVAHGSTSSNSDHRQLPLHYTNTGGGKITLVDLAGSERNYETTKMTAAMHRESADINYALMSLKDCFRAYNAQCSGSKVMQRSKSRCSSSLDDLSPARAPYRASLLTRVLRECFVGGPTATASSNREEVEDDGQEGGGDGQIIGDAGQEKSGNGDGRPHDKRHMTTIITTVSPTPTDMQHSINSLDHVVLMAPRLHDQVRTVTVEVPINGAALSHVPIEQWTSAQVNTWLATAEGGRFSQLVLPKGMTGAGLMQLNLVSLSAIFEGQLRSARQDDEGVAWVVEGGDSSNRHTYLGRALWSALRRQQQIAAVRAKHMAKNNRIDHTDHLNNNNAADDAAAGYDHRSHL